MTNATVRWKTVEGVDVYSIKLRKAPLGKAVLLPRPLPEDVKLHEDTIDKILNCGRHDEIELTIKELGQLGDLFHQQKKVSK